MKELTLLQTVNSRQQIYSFLANIFLQEPVADHLLTLQQTLKSILTESGEKNLSLAVDIDEVHHMNMENLRQEYYDCFFVPMSGKYVPPYESALRSYKPGKKKPYGFLNGPEAAHVASCYAAVGFVPSKLDMFSPWKEIQFPDHIGFELAFMATLCDAEIRAFKTMGAEGSESWERLQVSFLKEHLHKWLGNFAYALHELAPGYYAQAAQVAEKWVLLDLEALDKGGNSGGH